MGSRRFSGECAECNPHPSGIIMFEDNMMGGHVRIYYEFDKSKPHLFAYLFQYNRDYIRVVFDELKGRYLTCYHKAPTSNYNWMDMISPEQDVQHILMLVRARMLTDLACVISLFMHGDLVLWRRNTELKARRAQIETEKVELVDGVLKALDKLRFHMSDFGEYDATAHHNISCWESDMREKFERLRGSR